MSDADNSVPASVSTALADLYAFNAQWLREAVIEMPDDMRRWAPDDRANSIEVTVWHVARMTDIFRTRFLKGEEQDDELWFRAKYHERTGYDPRGIGAAGMGGVIGYTVEEVRAIPAFELEVLLEYFDATQSAMAAYLRSLADDALSDLRRGFAGDKPAYFYIRHILNDVTRHCGEVLAIAEMWRRRATD